MYAPYGDVYAMAQYTAQYHYQQSQMAYLKSLDHPYCTSYGSY